MRLAHAVDVINEPALSAVAYSQIRSDIISCRLLPNKRLPVEALRERYRVGAGPIRESLMQLVAEGLVQLEQNKGFRVSTVSREELLDLTRTRIEIEAIVLRWSIEHGGVEWEANLVGAFHRLSRRAKFDTTNNRTINEAWSHEHRSFHSALASACGSPTLLAIRDSLFDRAQRYVALSIMSKSMRRNDVIEHEQIMQAALARNVRRTTELNRAHIELTAEKVAKSLGEIDRRKPVGLTT